MIADWGLWIAAHSVYARQPWRGDSVQNRRDALRPLAVVLVATLLIACSGCRGPQAETPSPAGYGADQGDAPPPVESGGSGDARSAIYTPQPPTSFGAVKIGILPLTELAGPAGGGQSGGLNVYVVLLDAFGSQIKGPGVFRFELYAYIPRSAEQKGQRIAIWRDIDLTRPVDNNRYWRDFLHAYEFQLDIEADPDRPHVLEVTCVCPDGRRLSGEYLLRGGR